MWYTYILRSKKDRDLYIGSTNNIYRRLGEHNSGLVRFTCSRKPFELEAYIALTSEVQARELEKSLKSGSGHAFIYKRIIYSKSYV